MATEAQRHSAFFRGWALTLDERPDTATRTLVLPDDRVLTYAAYGDPRGVPVVYATGGNNSRLEAASFGAAAERAGARLISLDRPGFGRSTHQPGPTFLDWAADVSALLDELGLDRVHLLGLSGGGPHVLAVCHELPERVVRAGIVNGAAPPGVRGTFAGMWPPIRVLYALARWLPFPMLRSVQRAMSDPERNFTPQNVRRLRPPDAKLLTERPDVLEEIKTSMREAHRHGYDGAAWEWRLYTRPWGFELGNVSTEVRLWYAEQDGNAPPAMGRYLASALPNARLEIVSDQAHLSLLIDHGDRILAELIA